MSMLAQRSLGASSHAVGTARRAGCWPVLFLICFPITLFYAIDSAFSQNLREGMWGADGHVEAVASANGQVYLGGSFERVGPPTGGYAGLDIASGATLSPYLQVVG